MSETLANAIERLETVLNRETEALQSGNRADIADLAQRKNQSLLDLTRLQRRVDQPPSNPALRASLERLSAALAVNRRVLEAQIAASRDIADLVSGSLAERESDGTYSARPGRA